MKLVGLTLVEDELAMENGGLSIGKVGKDPVRLKR